MNIQKLLPYFITVIVAFLLFWFVQQTFFKPEKPVEQRTDYTETIERLRSDSIKLVRDHQEEINYLERKLDRLNSDHEQLQKDYAKNKTRLNNFSDPQLDSIRKRIYPN